MLRNYLITIFRMIASRKRLKIIILVLTLLVSYSILKNVNSITKRNEMSVSVIANASTSQLLNINPHVSMKISMNIIMILILTFSKVL